MFLLGILGLMGKREVELHRTLIGDQLLRRNLYKLHGLVNLGVHPVLSSLKGVEPGNRVVEERSIGRLYLNGLLAMTVKNHQHL